MADNSSAGGSKKRLFQECDEFEGVSEVRLSKKAKVHGVLTSLSPMITSSSGKSKYFDGRLTDGSKEVRLVGFDGKVHQKLSEFHKNNEAVAMSNCEVKLNKYSSDLEVVVRNGSELQQSPTKFDIDQAKFERHSEETTLADLQKISNFQKVSVNVKVMCEKEVQQVKGGLQKQEYIIADPTGTSMITTWEDNIGILQEGSSYKLSGLLVRTFSNKKYLSIPKDNSFKMTSIDDIGEVDDLAELENERKMTGAVIVGIKYFDSYDGCYSCNGKIMPSSDVLGDCSRCGTTQRLDRSKKMASAKMDFESEGVIRNLTAFSPILDEMCQESVTKAALLSCEPFDLEYSEKNIITSISR